MSSHAVAISLSVFAYVAARRYARDSRFAFGTWNIEILTGYTSAVFLLGLAAMMAFASVERMVVPKVTDFPEAIAVAGVGLAVNMASAFILGRADGHHDHANRDDAEKQHHRHDLNLRLANLHVIVEAATSVLAIVAHVGGMLFGWNWLDPVMGIVGAVLVAHWAWALPRDSGRVLLDGELDQPAVAEIQGRCSNSRSDEFDPHRQSSPLAGPKSEARLNSKSGHPRSRHDTQSRHGGVEQTRGVGPCNCGDSPVRLARSFVANGRCQAEPAT